MEYLMIVSLVTGQRGKYLIWTRFINWNVYLFGILLSDFANSWLTRGFCSCHTYINLFAFYSNPIFQQESTHTVKVNHLTFEKCLFVSLMTRSSWGPCILFIISWYHLRGDNPHTSSLTLPGSGQESQIETQGRRGKGQGLARSGLIQLTPTLADNNTS